MSTGRTPRWVCGVLGGAGGDLRRCVESLRRASIQVELFDTTSDRRHRDMAAAGVTVTPLSWTNSFAEVRNSALASMMDRDVGEVVLWLDSDEWLLDNHLGEFEGGALLPSDVAYCPVITDSTRATCGVARIHRITRDIEFRGAVHEYLVRSDGAPIEYLTSSLRIGHEGYLGWDRTERNDNLLRIQIELEPQSPRWRPFWVRDAGARLDASDLARAIREHARISSEGRALGGIRSDDYTRMIAWHGAFHLIREGGAELLQAALSRLNFNESVLESELLYLRLVASAHARVTDERLMQRALESRQASLDRGCEYPWLDAGICIGLEMQGRQGEAVAYRAASDSYTDPFCEDSFLRATVVEFAGLA